MAFDAVDAHDLSDFDAGTPARDYLLRRLADQGTLAHAVARHVRLETAQMRAIAKRDWNATGRWDEGGVVSARAARRYLSNWVTELTRSGPEDTVVAAHALAQPSDPFLQDRPSAFVSYENEVYGIAQAPLRKGQVESLIADCDSTGGLLVVVTRRPTANADLRHGDVLRMTHLKALAANAVLVGVDVFDGESYLLALLDDRAKRNGMPQTHNWEPRS